MVCRVGDLLGAAWPILLHLPIILYQEDNKINNFHNITFPWSGCCNRYKNAMDF